MSVTRKQNAILLSLKKEPYDKDITNNEGEQVHQIISEETLDEVENSEEKGEREKRKLRKRKIWDPDDPSCYQRRKYNLKWLNSPELKPWIAVIPDKPNFVSCRWCKTLLRAHLHDLKKHNNSKKHRKHSIGRSSLTKSENAFEEDEGTGILNYFASDPVEQKLFVKGNLTTSEPTDGSLRDLNPARIGFIGCGNMAQALLTGFLKNGLVEESSVIVSAPSNRNLQKLRPLGVRTTNNNNLVVEDSDIVFLCVKPHVIPEVLADLEPIEGSHNPLFVSIASGLSIDRLEAMLTTIVPSPRVIRTMPNTPCMVSQGCCVYSIGSHVQSSEGSVVKCLLGSVGLCEEVGEGLIDGVCGLAGSGPAYIYTAIEALSDGGVKMGLPRKLALAMAAQMVKGAASMVLETGKHPAQLKDEVCSPGGTTIAGMHALEKNGYRNSLISAVEASANRSKELG